MPSSGPATACGSSACQSRSRGSPSRPTLERDTVAWLVRSFPGGPGMRLASFAPKTIGQRMVLYIGAFTCAVLAATTWFDYTTSRRALEAQTDGEARKQVLAAAIDMDDFVSRVAVCPYSLP